MADSQILIIGSRGIVGSAVAEAAGRRAVKAARSPVASDTFPFDVLADDITQYLRQLQSPPKAVIIAVGISGVHTCAKDPVKSRHFNVDRVLAMATAVAEHGVLPVVFSTDCVFDGSPVLWSETDVPNPICEYGRQKLAAEEAITSAGIPHLTIRLSRVLADLAGRRDLLFQWCDQISKGMPVQIAADQHLTPIAAADVGRIVVALIDSNTRGLIQVAGPEQISSTRLFGLFSDACGALGVKLPIKRDLCKVSDLPGLDRRPANTMLSIKQLERIMVPRFMPLPEVARSVASVFASTLEQPKMGSAATS